MDIFDLQAALRLDKSKYDEGLDEAKSSAGKFGSLVSSTLGTASKVGLAAISAAATGVAALTAKAVGAYSNYEQLVGGIETLFGAQSMSLEEYANSVGQSVDAVRGKYNTLMEAQTTAMENADNAYKTAGMSTNKYMETITSFAAALKQSTSDEVEAAKVADVAIQDMSDNVSKMGSNMQSVQDAYQGFAKQNYTMLDNLKLGYGGTKEEMQRLLSDAEKISGIKYDINNLSDVFNAIHVIQQELGITGTTAKEAMYTIEGSANMTKAAWENVVIAIGKGEGLDKAFVNLTTAIFGDESGGGLLNNVIPRIQTVMEGVGDFITMSAPLIADKLPELVEAILPPLLNSAASLLVSLASALPGLWEVVWTSVFDALQILYERIVAEGPNLLSTAQTFMGNFVLAVQEKLPELLSNGMNIVTNIANGIISNLPFIISTAGSLMSSFLNYILSNLPAMMRKGFEMISSLASGIASNLPAILSAIASVIASLLSTIASNAPAILQKGIELIGRLAAGIIRGIPQAVAAIPSVISRVANAFSKYDWGSIGRNIVSGIARGLSSAAGAIVDAAKSAAKNALDSAKSFLGIKSPSRVFRDQVGKMMSLGMGIGIEDNAPIDSMINTVSRVVNKAKDSVSSVEIPIITSPYDGLTGLSSYTRGYKYNDNGNNEYEVDNMLRHIIQILLEYLPKISGGITLDGKKVSKGTYKYDMGFSSRESSLNKRLVGVK